MGRISRVELVIHTSSAFIKEVMSNPFSSILRLRSLAVFITTSLVMPGNIWWPFGWVNMQSFLTINTFELEPSVTTLSRYRIASSEPSSFASCEYIMFAKREVAFVLHCSHLMSSRDITDLPDNKLSFVLGWIPVD